MQPQSTNQATLLHRVRKQAFEQYRSMMELFDLPKHRADAMFKRLTSRDSVPYFFDLGYDEAERIAHVLTQDAIEQAVRRGGQTTGTCQICGRELTDPESKAKGIGPICEGRLNKRLKRTNAQAQG